MSSVSISMRTIAICFLMFVTVMTAFPTLAAAQTPTTGDFEVSAWIPYWRSERGVESILPRLEQFSEVNPFFYTVTRAGALHANGSLTDPEWLQLKAAAKNKDVLFIPTVMWSNADAMHEVLSDPAKRQAHIKSIATEVYRHDLDGIDIDYEARYARTREAYTQFHRELADAIGYDRQIMCTLQSRTPLDSRYSSADAIPTNIEYANDFGALGQYCDRVRIMAYDQGRIDVKLNEEKGDPYMPVADVDWVEKVMRVAAAEIEPSKLTIGVPTYGYEYDMFTTDGSVAGESDTTQYSRLWSFNPGYAASTTAAIGVEPVRNSAGELSLIYPARDAIDPTIPLPNATRLMSWSDAEAIRDKIELALELGLRGISIFKVDGGEDQNLWNVLPQYANREVAFAESGEVGISPAAGAVAGALPAHDLEYGDRLPAVRALQKYLNQSGYTVAQSGGGSPGSETTFFGPATRAALARFQAAHGISPAAGYYGPITRSTISAL